jgi:alkanesulfonate monooxygenase SsuD/methylene tetrahydromethanopterin reductase-like flavin-dependent oxidoreductase (luciferase family)
MPAASVAFGLFDHVDRSPEPLGTLYEHRLRLLEAADRLGFRSFHVAEHHATPLGMAPAPSVFLAAVAQRTRRLRFGPLVYILPLLPPLRLIEEVCMLDQLSGGRLELGVGRGISPYEMAYCGFNFMEAQEVYEEALEVLLAGLRAGAEGGRLTHRGRHFRYLGVPMELGPVQRPHPPLWQGVVSADSAARCARTGVSVVSNGPNAALRPIVERYWEVWDGRGGAAHPLVGAQRHVVVAETDAEARALAAPAYKVWYDSLVHLWRQFGSVPFRFAESLDRALELGTAIVGAPATVRAAIERTLEETGCNYLTARFAFGSLGFEPALRSLTLFGEEVLPRFQPAPAAAARG